MKSLLEMIMMFLNSTLRPHHIEAEISRNFHAFGKEGIFQSDLQILENWCQSIIKIDENTEAIFKISEQSQRKALEKVVGDKNLSYFLDLVRLVKTLHQRIVKKPSWFEQTMGKL